MARTLFPKSPTALFITLLPADWDFFSAFSTRALCAFLATSVSLRMVLGDFGLCMYTAYSLGTSVLFVNAWRAPAPMRNCESTHL